ncbi:hypothetical protein DVS28_b0380 (plasmid) [Euzebya pacifica]|uniref:Uncharacterized protein n=1 Tax=Euzebya pacifica TaxID=1608957 RepID=A0A346Y6Q3_9ACTN|nr:hypothetical protein [Euzebya pacifica]AXV10150.1 hypothetical protein DVS28_b0380 [Euzebya pacifica]
MAGYLCGKPTATGGHCKNTVATPGGPCGATHTAPDLMAALKASIATHKTAQHAAVSDPFHTPQPMADTTHTPASTGTVEVPAAFRTTKDRAYTGARVALAPMWHTKGLAVWQLKGHATRGDAAAAELAATISDLRATDTGGYVGPTDDPEIPEGLTGKDAYVEGLRQMTKAVKGIESATDLMSVTADERSARLATAHGRAHAAVKLFSTAKDTITKGLSDEEYAAVPGVRASRKAASAAIRDARSRMHAFSSAPRVKATVGVLNVAQQHVANALAAMDADHVDDPEFDYQAMSDLGPSKCADAALGHLGDAQKSLAGASGLTDTDKVERLKSAHTHIVMAAAYADAAYETFLN